MTPLVLSTIERRPKPTRIHLSRNTLNQLLRDLNLSLTSGALPAACSRVRMNGIILVIHNEADTIIHTVWEGNHGNES